MGSTLARLATHRGRRLPANAFKVLLAMAWTALDEARGDTEGGLYFGGWEPLALAMGHDVPARSSTDPADQKRRMKLEKYVTEALRSLRDEGLIRPQEPGFKAGFGRRQVYVLDLDLHPKKWGAAAPQETGGFAPQETGGNSPPLSGSVAPQEAGGLFTTTNNDHEQPNDRTTHPPALTVSPVRRRCGNGELIAIDGTCGCADHWAVS